VRLILWAGKKHSGKTTTAQELAEKLKAAGFTAAGFLAPSIYNGNGLQGFEIVDLQTNSRAHLAVLKEGGQKGCSFDFLKVGLELGKKALEPEKVKNADLVIVDEFGPLELAGQGWRESVDSLIKQTNVSVLFIVREELAEPVRDLYERLCPLVLETADSDSIMKIIDILKDYQGQMGDFDPFLPAVPTADSADERLGSTEITEKPSKMGSNDRSSRPEVS